MSNWTLDIRRNGRFNQPIGPFPRGIVSQGSVVLVSICEILAVPGERPDFPFIGSAIMTIHNIAPRRDFVDVHIFIDWDSPLNCRLSITVDAL